MTMKALVLLFVVASVYGASHNVPDVPSFIPEKPTEPTWKASPDYLAMRHHDIMTRDHGCVELQDGEAGKSFQCVNIWLKNRFSAAQIKPNAVFLDYQHPEEKKEDAFKPTVSWVENINAWRVRACVAHPGGKQNSLAGGKLRWLAVYNTTNSNVEQYGTISNMSPLTSSKKCIQINFPIAFSTVPTLKFQVKLKYGLMTAQDALVLWAKGVSQTGATLCAEEFYGWSRYHHEFEIYWYGISAAHQQDSYSQHNKVVFPANEQFPADHRSLNYFYCKNVTLTKWHYPCPAVLVQAVEPSTAVCESTLIAWVAYLKIDMMTVCYADKRGIMGVRKVDVEVHYTIYGAQDKCQSHTCPANQECVHPTWDTVTCGCYQTCDEADEPHCGTNMVTYKNRCQLEKAACESGFKFSYAHHGKCEDNTMAHGRHQLQSVSGCEGLYCSVISTGNRIWYGDADIKIQISVNWMNSIDGDRISTHDATASWIEDVKPTSFKACVMEAGRKTLAKGPYINWFAYQGSAEKIMTRKIEVGEWRSGTHCVPLHERTIMEKPMPEYPPSCPRTDLEDYKINMTEEKWHYDSHLMSKIYGQEQYEWFQRMLKGYGVKKLKLTNGMEINGASLMLTVEQSEPDNQVKVRDAVNAWIEFDGATKEAYVCLREMQNWDGQHKGIKVHWSLFLDKSATKENVFNVADANAQQNAVSAMADAMLSNNMGFMQKMLFKPSLMAPEESNYAFCQVRRFLPMNFSAETQSTVLVSIGHHIPVHAAFESMKKYQLHQMEVRKGMPMGDLAFNDEEQQQSWMMPHMWRANLTGWRPHMRISKNTDYSAWVEGMNNTHIRVCQKSVFTGYHYEGVAVNLIIFPDRCPEGYTSFRNGCGKLSDQCGTFEQAVQSCQSSGDTFMAPEDAAHNVFFSYLAGQQSIYVARSDSATEGDWKRRDGETSDYVRWAVGEPKATPTDLDCSVQSGRSGDFTESAQKCDSCYRYVCARAAAPRNCDFPYAFCANDGVCSNTATGPVCRCVPPFTGTRCETKQ